MCKPKVFIDPSVRIKYSSFYIRGLYDFFGKKNVKFSPKYFKQLERKTESHSYDHYMAFVVVTGKELKKYIIDFRDKRSVKKSAYDWCDRYAKINFSNLLTDKCFHDKIESIPPGFGINIWGKFEMAFYCVSNFIKCNFSPLVSTKAHLLDYYLQLKRPALEKYTSGIFHDEEKPYVFMIGTLWNHKNCMEETNLLRRKFVEVCKSMNIDFEGGFFSSSDHPQYKDFKSLIFTERYSPNAYVGKTKKSFLVFNTPAVHDCHGWKLGEYLAMGKAIISSPLSNQLPESMVHGQNIHFVSNEKELKESIPLLLSDKSYRRKLETGAKNYYLQYGCPKAIIKNLVKGKVTINKEGQRPFDR
ncbi:glycosyltransferase [Salinimicrobium flavum]|uniref:Glycosyltransferase n=1 Tax=Salinimicrobium flavum TaxID=1737065 RepID=A0ABW5J1H7_9FLAO